MSDEIDREWAELSADEAMQDLLAIGEDMMADLRLQAAAQLFLQYTDETTHTEPTMIRLIPDLDDELTHRLAWLSEVLTGWDETDLEDDETFEDPEEAAAAAAAEAVVDRLLETIRPTQTDPRTPSEVRVDGRWVPQSTAPAGYAGRLLAADGRYEFAPVRLVEVTDADIATIRAICNRIIWDIHGPLNEVADQVAAAYSDEPRLNGPARAHQVLGLMDVLERTPETDQNARILIDALTGHDPDTDLILTVPQAAAYQAWTDATNTDLGGGGLDRFGRAGFSY